ncbi:MAG: InlB B-repeat-containing protein [Treponema sp.]
MKRNNTFGKLMMFSLICLLAFSSCKHDENKPKNDETKPDNGKTEVATLKLLNIGDYVATANDIKEAAKTTGFPKEFESNVSTVEINAVPEDGGSVDFGSVSKTVMLTESVKTIMFKVKKAGKTDGTYTLKLSKKKPALPTLQNLKATDFKGVLPQNEKFNVIDTTVSWDAFAGAAYYQVFINDAKTSDEELTKTEFRTMTGKIEVNDLMGEEEKDVKITVKAFDSSKKLIAEGSITKKLPKKAGIENVYFNDKPHSENMKVSNPLTIKVKFHNNPVIFYDDMEKLKAYLNTHMKLVLGALMVPLSYLYDESENTMTIMPTGGLNEKYKYDFTISKYITDKFGMNYSKQESVYQLAIEKPTETPPAPDVLKVLINDDASLNIKDGEKTNINVESSVSIYFNQLVYQPSYELAGVSEGGSKGQGIFITIKPSGTAGDDASRLAEGVWETVMEGGKAVTKVTFKMVGKLFYTQKPYPLLGNTKYYIVIDDTLRAVSNTKFSEKRFNFTTGAEKPVLHKFQVQDGEIVGKTEEPKNETELKEGDKVKIKPIVPNGKKFDSWNIGSYSSLTEQQKKTEEMEYTMIDQDVTIYATFKD